MFEVRGRRPINRAFTKSSPCPTDWNLSDTEPEEQAKNGISSQTDSSFSPPTTPEKPSKEFSYTKSKSPPSEAVKERQVKKRANISFTIAAVVILLLALAMLMITIKLITKKSMCSFDELQNRYPRKNSIVWESLSIGIENILNKETERSAVYLFVHEGGTDAHNLMNEIIMHTANCFDKSNALVEMVAEDFNSKNAIRDYGTAIEKYKIKIQKSNVISIVNLNQIPATAARALHTICDTHSPIVKGVVIFLNLEVSTSTKAQKPTTQAEQTLRDLWNLDSNILNSLITRLTDQVLPIENDS